MSKSKSPKKKKVVVSTQKRKAGATSSRQQRSPAGINKAELTFGKENYKWMGIGIVLIFIGMLLMAGGDMPGPEEWDDSIIYSFRRTVLAPVVILAGLAVEIYAIFKK